MKMIHSKQVSWVYVSETTAVHGVDLISSTAAANCQTALNQGHTDHFSTDNLTSNQQCEAWRS